MMVFNKIENILFLYLYRLFKLANRTTKITKINSGILPQLAQPHKNKDNIL